MLTLVPGSMGGSETYAGELVRHLAERTDVEVVTGLAASARGFTDAGTTLVIDGIGGGGSARERISSQFRAELSPSLRRLVRDADLVHYPLTVPSPRAPRGRPFVQTLLDTQHHDLRHNFAASELLYRRLRYDVPAKRADAVITISEFCKQQIVRNLRLEPDRVHVAHLGVDADEFTANTAQREQFVLYPARGWPHKNHARLIEAMGLVRQSRPDLTLVLTGGGLESLGALPAWVDVKGLVSRQELLSLYQRAACLAFPSLYEGFGLPPLEAMASGCPVAAASSGSLPEVCGDAATMFDAEDPASIARGIIEALDGASELTALGLARAREFSWDRCAEAHVNAYRAALGMRAEVDH